MVEGYHNVLSHVFVIQCVTMLTLDTEAAHDIEGVFPDTSPVSTDSISTTSGLWVCPDSIQ